MWLYVRYAPAGNIVLMVELVPVGTCPMFLVLVVRLAVMLVVRIVLKWLAQVHLHGVSLVTVASVHHHVVALIAVTMTLVEHAVLLRRLGAGGTRWGRSVWVVEGYTGASGGRSHSAREVS